MYSKESAPIGRRACPARARLSAPNPIQSNPMTRTKKNRKQSKRRQRVSRQASLVMDADEQRTE